MACSPIWQRRVGPNKLTWHQYPEPGGQSYYDSDLDHPDKVQRLFDLCQMLEAYITASGWRFLMSEYGVSGLLEINRGSGWFAEEDDAEATEEMRHH